MRKVWVSDKGINKIPNIKNIVFAATISGLIATSPVVNAKKCNINSNNYLSAWQIHNPETQYWLSTEWFISNWDVQIVDPQWNNIYNSYTDTNWQVVIDKDVLLNNLQNNWYQIESLDNFELPLTVQISWWTMLDSNGNFCTDKRQKTFNWEYSAIWDIAQLNNATIWTTSTLVENIVNWRNNKNINAFIAELSNDISTEQEIIEITERLKSSIDLVVWGLEDNFKLKDTNNDWVINNTDVLQNPHKQRKTNNILNKNRYKKVVRKWFENKQARKEKWIKSKMNLVILEHTYTWEDYIVKMDSITDWVNVKYSYQKNWKNGINADINDEIILQEWEKIYFREKYNSKRKKWEVNTIEVKDWKLYRNTEIIGYPIVENNEEEIDYEELLAWIENWMDSAITNNRLQELNDEIYALEQEIDILMNSNLDKETLEKELLEINNRLLILREELRLEAIKIQELLAEKDTIALNSTGNLNTLLASVEQIVTEIWNSILSTANAAELTYTQALQDAKAKISELNTQISTLVKTWSLTNLEYIENKEWELRVSIHNLEGDVARLKNTMDWDQASVNMALRNIDWTKANKQEFSDLLTNITFPDKSNFPIDQWEFPEYHLEVLEEYTYKDMNMKGVLIMKNWVSFPAELHTVLDWKRVWWTITINSKHHRYNVKDPLAEFLEYYLRVKYYTDKIVELEQELIWYRNDLVISTSNYNTENNLLISQVQAYEDLKRDFTNTYQITEPIPGSGFPNDFDGTVTSLFNEVYLKYRLLTKIENNKDSLETKIAEQNALVNRQQEIDNQLNDWSNNDTQINDLEAQLEQARIDAEAELIERIKNIKVDYIENPNSPLANKTAKTNQSIPIENIPNSYLWIDYTLHIDYNSNYSWDGLIYPLKVWATYTVWWNIITTESKKIYYADELRDYSDSWLVTSIWKAIKNGYDLYDSWIEGEEINNNIIENNNNELYALFFDFETECWENARILFPTTWEWSLVWNWEKQLDYVNNCPIYSSEKWNLLIEWIKKYLEFKNNLLQAEIKWLEWFWTWYAKAIYDTAEFIQWLNYEELSKILGNLILSTEEWVQYIANIWAYWRAATEYWLNWTSESKQVRDNLANQLSFWPEIQEIQNLLSDIDWTNIENNAYWAWYIWGYLAENMVVWYTIDKWVKGVSKYWLAKIKTIILKLRIASNIWKLSLNKIDFDLVKKNINDTEIIKFQAIIDRNFEWYSDVKKWRFLERMTLMDDYTQNEYFNNFDKYKDNFEVGWKYNNLQRKLNWKQYQLKKVWNNFIISNNWIVLDWEDYLDYVVMKDWNILFWESHSFLSNWENVIYAWWFEIYNWKVKFWNCFSWHYKPKVWDEIGKNSVKNYFLNEYDLDLNTIEFTWVSTTEFQTWFFTY